MRKGAERFIWVHLELHAGGPGRPLSGLAGSTRALPHNPAFERDGRGADREAEPRGATAESLWLYVRNERDIDETWQVAERELKAHHAEDTEVPVRSVTERPRLVTFPHAGASERRVTTSRDYDRRSPVSAYDRAVWVLVCRAGQ